MFKNLFILLIATSLSSVFAQQDSVKNYTLEEITVKSGLVVQPRTTRKVDLKEIKYSDAASLTELGRYIPNLKTQTNSRGQTLFYFRGSGERQLALYFDGAPLNIPWDNRIDLNLVPTSAVEGVRVTKGIPSVIYGANSVAGVVNVNSVDPVPGELNTKISASLGNSNYQKYSAVFSKSSGSDSWLVSAGYNRQNDFTLPASFQHPDNPSQTRANTSRKSFSGYLKYSHSFDSFGDVSASLSFIDAKKNIPAELDVAKPRYWQYPLWQMTTANVNGSLRFGNSSKSLMAYTFSASMFKLQIDQFNDSEYVLIDDVEKNNDKTVFGRITFTRFAEQNSLIKFVVSDQYSRHEESFLSDGFAELFYAQNLFSAGAEYEYSSTKFSFTAGGGFDMQATPLTGDKPGKDALWDYNLNFTAAYFLFPEISLQAIFGRKTRFPTLRETFSGALGRFVPNPELKAETVHSAEVRATYYGNADEIDLSVFTNFTNNGIQRMTLPGRQFQRINKVQIRTAGAEFSASYNFSEQLRTTAHFAALSSFAKSAEGNFSDTLEYKPGVIAGFDLIYESPSNFGALMEANYVGAEFGLQEGNPNFQKLPDYLILNFRLWKSFVWNGNKIDLFIRTNNLFDKLYYAKWGLPEEGRNFRAGVSFEL